MEYLHFSSIELIGKIVIVTKEIDKKWVEKEGIFMAITVFGFPRRTPATPKVVDGQVLGREVASLRLYYLVHKGSYQEAVDKANQHMAESLAAGFTIRCLPMAESYRVSLKSNPSLPRPWGIFVLEKDVLKACENKPMGNSRQVEVVVSNTPDGLVDTVNKRTFGREVVDIEIIYDDMGPEPERWKANLYFLFDTLNERKLD